MCSINHTHPDLLSYCYGAVGSGNNTYYPLVKQFLHEILFQNVLNWILDKAWWITHMYIYMFSPRNLLNGRVANFVSMSMLKIDAYIHLPANDEYTNLLTMTKHEVHSTPSV